MTMQDWKARLDAFLQFNEREILTDAGRVSHEVAQQLAETEFDKYEAQRQELEANQPTSDFDRLVEETNGLPPGDPREKAQ